MLASSLRGLMIWFTRNRMESEKDQEPNRSNSETTETKEERPRVKLRDLRPARDPMGAARKSSASAPNE